MITKKPYEEVLQDFVDHAELYEAGECNLIAQNTDFGVEIYLGGEVRYGSGLFPCLTVFADDDTLFDEVAYTSEDFREMLAEIYDTFLSPDFIDTAAEMDKLREENAEADGEPPDDEPFDEEQDEIDEQESILDEHVLAFLAAAYGYDPLENADNAEETLDKLKGSFCQACTDIVGEGVYRPLYVEDENGDWVFERYPYEQTVDAE